MAQLLGRTAIITGAASGIGAAAARLFLDEGARVVLNDLRPDPLSASVANLPPERALAFPGDASDRSVCRDMVAAAIAHFGRLDVLVNNAGVVATGDVETTEEDDFRRVLDINVTGYFLLAEAAMPELRKTRGAVVMTSSVSGLGGDWGLLAYNTSKGAISNMVRAMAIDAGQHGVRVNAIAPTLTKTPMAHFLMEPEVLSKFTDRIPLGRAAEP